MHISLNEDNDFLNDVYVKNVYHMKHNGIVFLHRIQTSYVCGILMIKLHKNNFNKNVTCLVTEKEKKEKFII